MINYSVINEIILTYDLVDTRGDVGRYSHLYATVLFHEIKFSGQLGPCQQ